MKAGLRLTGTIWLIAAWTIMSVCQAGSEDDKKRSETMGGKVADSPIINGRLFADSRSSSFLQVSGQPTGEEVWFTALPKGASGRAQCLGLHGDNLIVGFGNSLAVLDRVDGKLRWSRDIIGNHLFALEDAGIVTLDHAGYFVLIGYDGEPVEEVFLSAVDPNVFLHALLRDGANFVYCLEERPEPTSEPTDDPVPAVSRFIRYFPDRMKVLWQHNLPIHLRGIVFSRDSAQVYVATPDQFFTFPVAAASSEEVVSLEWPDLVSLSAAPDGSALVADTNGGRTNLSSVRPDGETGWSFSFDRTDLSAQPPASSPDGFVYLVVGSELHQIRNGELLWSYRFKAKTEDIAITVLADNSVLAAAGQALVHLSAGGEEMFTKWLETPIGTRPIMDEDGKVYYGGVDGIHCLR